MTDKENARPVGGTTEQAKIENTCLADIGFHCDSITGEPMSARHVFSIFACSVVPPTGRAFSFSIIYFSPFGLLSF